MAQHEEYIAACERIGVFTLFCLREGSYMRDILSNMCCGENNLLFEDVLALLIRKEFVSIAGEVVSITPNGRIYLLEHERTYVHSDGTMVLHPSWLNLKRLNVRFKDLLKGNAKSLKTFLIKNDDYVNSPGLFVDFLIGKNSGSDVSINPARLIEVCSLLKELRKHNYLQLSNGHDWSVFIEERISPFSINKEKEQIKKYERRAHGIRWLKTNTVKHIDEFITSLPIPKSR